MTAAALEPDMTAAAVETAAHEGEAPRGRAPRGRSGWTDRSGVHGERGAVDQAGQRRALYQLVEVLVQAQAVLGGDGMQVGLRLAELPQAGFVPVQLALGEALAHGHGAEYHRAHPGEAGERLVPVLPGAEVDLRHPLKADFGVHVDQHADLHAVAGEER